MKKEVEVWGWQYAPYSTDPMDYDDTVHHVAWTSVLGTLVSNYSAGKLTPQIAAGWSTNPDYTEWTFNINPTCRFENGDKITPEVVANSLKRIAMLQKKAKSISGFTEDLVGIEKLDSMQTKISGIAYDANSLTLKFQRPKKDLLQQLSFGLYAVVHPTQYDSNGTWIDKDSIISSGLYKVKSRDVNHLRLDINNQNVGCFPDHAELLQNISISFGTKDLDISKQVMISGSSKSLMLDDSFVLTHLTGYRQPKQEWISQMREGRFIYHRMEAHAVTVSLNGSRARLTGDTHTDSTVSGSRRQGGWRLRMVQDYEWSDGQWT
ncbi:MAG: DUF4440 domain-containing protein, partial [Proteobacteria bacterium]